jgi:hypothetical protein
VTKKAKLSIVLVATALASGTAFASLSGAQGNADRIILREGYSQYQGRIDLRETSGTVTYYYWGGDRCPATPVPSNRQIDILLAAHNSGHAVSLDYNNVTGTFGTNRCWDGGIQVW